MNSTPGACLRIPRSRRRSRAVSRVISRLGILLPARRFGASNSDILGMVELCQPRAISCSRAPEWANSSAYRADTGERLWSAETQAGVLAAPIAYEVDGEQYVAVEVGWGRRLWSRRGRACADIARGLEPASGAGLQARRKRRAAAASNGGPRGSRSAARYRRPRRYKAGKALYQTYCSTCHGDNATGSGVLPDLRYSAFIADAGCDGFDRAPGQPLGPWHGGVQR